MRRTEARARRRHCRHSRIPRVAPGRGARGAATDGPWAGARRAADGASGAGTPSVREGFGATLTGS